MGDVGTVEAAARAIEREDVVVYPTGTVYGLGADACAVAAIERVYRIKRRERAKPISVAVPDLPAVEAVAHLTPHSRAFMESFLPGPVTVVCRRRAELPDALTAGGTRVGVRIPDHPVARDLLRRTPPLTATSANRSGEPAVTALSELPEGLKEEVAVLLDGGRTNGEPSTVVDVDRGVIHRRGAQAEAVNTWLASHADQAGSDPSP